MMKKDFVLFFILIISLISCVKKETSAPEGMVLVSAGEFIMGSDDIDKDKKASEYGTVKPFYLDEHPRHKVNLKAFYIDKYEITNDQFKKFVTETGSTPPSGWGGRSYPEGRDSYPASTINWYQAKRYCEWAGKRLPTEAEWEKAARGTDGREFPWGNEFDKSKANTGDSLIGDLSPVGKFEDGKSPFGVYDMAGNVWEWVEDWYKPYKGSDFKSDVFGEKYKVLRGGSWGGTGHYAIPHFYRTEYRFYAVPENGFSDTGFRCAKSVK